MLLVVWSVESGDCTVQTTVNGVERGAVDWDGIGCRGRTLLSGMRMRSELAYVRSTSNGACSFTKRTPSSCKAQSTQASASGSRGLLARTPFLVLECNGMK